MISFKYEVYIIHFISKPIIGYFMNDENITLKFYYNIFSFDIAIRLNTEIVLHNLGINTFKCIKTL